MTRLRLNTKLILLTLIIEIPAIVLIAFFGIRGNDAQKKEILAQNQTQVQVMASKIDSFLDYTENSLAYMSVDDAKIRQIAGAGVKDGQFWLENHDVLQKLEAQTAISSVSMTTFIYYPAQDIFYNSDVNPQVTSRIMDMVRDPDSFVSRTWSIMECEGTRYLYLLIDYGDYVIGAFDSFEHLLVNTVNEPNGKYVFTDDKGLVLSDDQKTVLPVNEEKFSYNGNEWYQVHAVSTKSDFALMMLLDREYVDSQMESVFLNIFIIAAVFAILLVGYIVCLRIWIMKPVGQLRSSMEIIRAGDLDYRITGLNSSGTEFNSVMEEFNRLMDHIEELKIEIYEKDLEQREVRLEYLNRQIQPHFILNTLNTLYNYSDADIEVTRRMIRLISQYYRYVVNVNSQYVELGQELDHIDHYMELQSLRYPGLFKYEITCSEELGKVLIPPFIIESFIGNSFKHGLVPGCVNNIFIHVQKQDKYIVITTGDSGPGFSEDSQDAIDEFLSAGTVSDELGVGIRNSIERLKLIYKEKCNIRFSNRSTGGSLVEILIETE